MRSDQNELSVKSLLKQVYTAHATRVKYLEDEIEVLKAKLLETEKKCKEIEVPHEPQKQILLGNGNKIANNNDLEENGCKFSVFNNPDNKCDSDHHSGVKTKLSSVTQCEISNSDKPHTSKEHFLKNLMNNDSNEFHSPSSVCGTQGKLNDYSTLNVDSVVLAPDTACMEQILDNNNEKMKGNSKEAHMKNIGKITDVEVSKSVLDSCKKEDKHSKMSKKRPLAESSLLNIKPKKAHNGDAFKMSPLKNDINKIRKSNKSSFSPEKLKEDKASKEEVQIIKKLSNENVNLKEQKLKCFQKVSSNVPLKENAIDHNSDKTKSKRTLDGTTLKDSVHEVSPSLLPANKKNDNLLHNVQLIAEDNDDFETPKGNKKNSEDQDVWIVCDKKKVKKSSNPKAIKSTSKFKMTLDSLPLNYKKPTYKQTKLSKSIFMKKSITDASSTGLQGKADDETENSSSEVTDQEDLVRNSEQCSPVDFDATCIPDNYRKIISTQDVVMKGKSSVKKVDEILMVEVQDSESSSEEADIKNVKIESKPVKGKFDDFHTSTSDSTKKALSSFDRLPRKQEPNYKYKEETVRKKDERMQLNGFDCKECERYYQDFGLSDEEKRDRLKKCSRHRAKFAPPATPEHFWEIDFPDTMECRARGYMNETQKVKLKPHRRRPL